MLSVTAQMDVTVNLTASSLLIGSLFTIPISQKAVMPRLLPHSLYLLRRPSVIGHSSSMFIGREVQVPAFLLVTSFVPPPSLAHPLIGLIALRLLGFLFPDYPPPSRLQLHPPFCLLAGTQILLSYYLSKSSD